LTLLELNFLRRRAKAEAATLLDTAVAESRSLTIPEQARFDALAARIHDLDAAIAERENLRRLVK